MPDIVGRLRSPRLTPAPGSPVPGEMYYDTGSNTLLWWSGTAWVPSGSGGVSGSSWVGALSAAPVLDVGMTGEVRAGRQITLADFTALGLGTPVAIWSLGLSDGGGGGSKANDSSGNGRNLTNKAANVNTGVSGINNLASTAANFTGKATETLFISDLGSYTDQFRLATGSWGCWSQTMKIGTLQPCVGKWGGAAQTRAYTLLVDSTNVATTSVFIDGTNAVGSTYGTTNVADGRWHFLVGTYDGSTVRLYVDGVLEGATATTGWPIYITATGPVNVGSLGGDASTAASYSHWGNLDEAFITADVLTLDQIRYLYCAKIPHALAKVPTAVSLNVRRRRKGAALVASADFGTYNGFWPARLHNFTAGSLADEGSNATPLALSVSLLGTIPGFACPLGSGPPAATALTVPAAGIPVGSTVVLIGYQNSASSQPTAVDSKGNTYTRRSTLSSGVFVLDSQITTALVSGDTITVTMTVSPFPWAVAGAWFSRCVFDKMTQVTLTSAAADGGAITTASGGGPVMGVFSAMSGTTTIPSIVTPGAGYTSEPATGRADPAGDVGHAHALLWEYKNGAGGVAEDATATLSGYGGVTAPASAFGATVAYTAPPAPPSAGADGAQGGAVNFNGSFSLGSSDAGLPSGSSIRTFGCWFKTSTRAVMGLIAWGTDTAFERIITLSDGTLRFDSSQSDLIQGPFVADGQWHQVVEQDNINGIGAKRFFYVDGKLVGTSPTLASLTLGGANRFQIGATQDGANRFIGQIDGAFVCPGVFGVDVISGLYAKGSQALTPSPKDPGAHIEAVDASNVYAAFDTLESQHTLDLLVGA